MVRNIGELEEELHKRLPYHYDRGRVQNNERDTMTKYIYKTHTRDELVERTKHLAQQYPTYNKRDLFNYAANRRYNFWSAQGVEHIFVSHQRVEAEQDRYHQSIDFWIDGMPFDHKTSVLPRWRGKDLAYAQSHRWELIDRLYTHQSQQQRLHMRNRIFVLVAAEDGAHWRLKADLGLLQHHITQYLDEFTVESLYSFSHQWETIYSDIIWYAPDHI